MTSKFDCQSSQRYLPVAYVSIQTFDNDYDIIFMCSKCNITHSRWPCHVDSQPCHTC